MGRAILLPGTNPVFQTHPKLTFQRGAYAYMIETHGGQSTYSVSDGVSTISAPIQWVFGAGAQTYVLQREGRFYESMVSYFPTLQALDITVGDDRIHPQTLAEAFGRELLPDEYTACFGCHSTGAVVRDRLNLSAFTPGIQCERCHAATSNHLQVISRGKRDALPPRLKNLYSEEISNLCGQCHGSWETIAAKNLRGVFNVRFQPYRLANSKCFDGSDSRLSCIACHNPHQELVRDSKKYDANCLACHAPVGSQISTGLKMSKSCPVGQSGCVGCHMPKVDLPGGHIAFTDHNIRVARAGESYPN